MSDERTIKPNAPADFAPQLGDYKTLQPFRYWCQKVLPLVYDDSLSYYELLCKVVDYLNKTMEDVETLHGDVANLHTAYIELQNYVNNYFSTLDVQQEINNKLDNMASNGTLSSLIAPLVTGSPVIVSSTTEMTDKTKIYVLLPDGHMYRWDGDKFSDTGYVYASNNYPWDNLPYSYNNNFVHFYSPYNVNGYLNNNGSIIDSETYKVTPFIKLNKNIEIYNNLIGGAYTCFYNENFGLISSIQNSSIEKPFTMPENSYFVRFSILPTNYVRTVNENYSDIVDFSKTDYRVNENLINYNSPYNKSGYYNQNGALIPSETYKVTPLIKFKGNATLYTNLTTSAFAKIMDVNFLNEKFVNINGNYTPDNDCYISFSILPQYYIKLTDKLRSMSQLNGLRTDCYFVATDSFETTEYPIITFTFTTTECEYKSNDTVLFSKTFNSPLLFKKALFINTNKGTKIIITDGMQYYESDWLIQLSGNLTNTFNIFINNETLLVGDSYYSYANTRVSGQLVKLGLDCKTLSFPGATPSTLYTMLMNVLQNYKPNAIIWGCGMNGDNETNITVLNNIIEYCSINDIRLYVCTIPNTASKDNTNYNKAVLTSNNNKSSFMCDLRKSVQDDNNNWYPNFLSSDGVHPTEFGARALAITLAEYANLKLI